MKHHIAHITTVDMSLKYLLLRQLTTIQEEGYDVTGVSSPGEYVEFIEEAGIRHINVPMTRRLSPLADLISLYRLWRVMRKERFTIVHTHTPKPGLFGQIAARMAGVPIVINTLHGFYFHDNMPAFKRRFLIYTEKIAALCSDVILSQNSEDISTAIDENICRPDKIKFLGNGIDLERFNAETLDETTIDDKRQAIGLHDNSPVIGFVGRLVAAKGILELMSAMKEVVRKMPDAQLLVIGPLDGEKRDSLTAEIARDYDLQDNVIFTGMRHDMPDMYGLMDVFVLPSHREGFPRSLMEASAMGVPCIATDIRGCREAVEHGVNGLLVPLGDVDALAESIIKLLDDAELSRKLGRNGRSMAEQKFDEQAVFDKVKQEYARLLKEKGIQ